MIVRDKIPPKVVLGLLAAICLDTALQLFWKTAVLALPASGATQSWLPFVSIFSEPLFIGVAAVMIVQFLNWIILLGRADLSFAQPIAALSYVSVCVLSGILFNEHVDRVQVVGIAFVLAGVWFITRTGHVSERGDSEATGRPALAAG
jgi:drug/metabolite transporter (DMT)-like permease